jgi:NAD+ synthase (glutamine-hydrolysing)
VAVNSGRDTGRAAGGFGSLYRHGFARVAVAIPRVTVADPASNAEQIIALARQAAVEHAVLTVFPEMSLSSYTADDLFHQDALQDAVLDALRDLAAASTGLGTAVVMGAPLRADGLLFNCAVVV